MSKSKLDKALSRAHWLFYGASVGCAGLAVALECACLAAPAALTLLWGIGMHVLSRRGLL
jgi:hypothetical protein